MTSAHLPAISMMDSEKRQWLITTTTAGGVAVIGTSVPFVSSFAPSERVKAMGGAIEVDLNGILPGETKTVEWRGKPVWILRRTPDMLAALEGHDADLADPMSLKDDLPKALRNSQRSLRPEWLVTVGICTHLGCSPSAVPQGTLNPSVPVGWPGGYVCPCHGSTFDLAGRVYKNKPAPTNLEIPPHHFASDTRLVIGEPAPG